MGRSLHRFWESLHSCGLIELNAFFVTIHAQLILNMTQINYAPVKRHIFSLISCTVRR